MPRIESENRYQMIMTSLDDEVCPESIARIIDLFVESLDFEVLCFKKANPATEGRPSYPPKALLKLYLYGHQFGIRSSRKLAYACQVNLEVKWMLGNLTPDYRTISDFRKDNIDCMKKVFHAFNHRLLEVVTPGFLSVDGSKFRAWNSKKNNFTANKLDDRITWLNQHSDEYLRLLAEMDENDEEAEPGQFTREEIEEKLAEATKRLERYTLLKQKLEESGESQISLVDPSSKLMKDKDGFTVGYNLQTAVDSQTHLIRDYQLTNQPTDHNLIHSTVAGINKNQDEVIEVVADKGYNSAEDMVTCLENGIIPHVILPDGKDSYELEIDFEESEITNEKRCSTAKEDLKECLHAGVIPEAYEDAIQEVAVVEKKVLVKEETDEKKRPVKNLYGTEEQMQERAKQGYFVRDVERNLVYCPSGQTLRQKCIKKNGNIRYANRLACKSCPYRNQCFKGKSEWMEIDFNKDTLEKPNRKWLEATGNENTAAPVAGEVEDSRTEEEKLQETWGQVVKEIESEGNGTVGEEPTSKEKKAIRHYVKKKVVKIILKPDRRKMAERMCLSEHPFGTLKRALDGGYYLLKGKRKVDGESALICLSYNLKRAQNLLSFDELSRIMA